MEENHLVEPKAEHPMALDTARPFGGRLISERGVEGDRPAPPGRLGSGQQPSRWEALRGLARESSVRLWNDDEADPAERVELLSQARGDRAGGMEYELAVAESDHRHAYGDGDQPGLPGELVLGAPEVRGMANQFQRSDSND